MRISEKTQWAIIVVVLLLGLSLFGYELYQYYQKQNMNAQMQRYFTNLMSARSVAIVMDLRNAPDSRTRYNINMCGIGVAGSPALASKPKYIYGIDNDRCIISYPNNTHESNASVERCEREINEFVNIIIKYGKPHTEFTDNSMIIYIDRNTNASCRLAIKTGSVAINPNETSQKNISQSLNGTENGEGNITGNSDNGSASYTTNVSQIPGPDENVSEDLVNNTDN